MRPAIAAIALFILSGILFAQDSPPITIPTDPKPVTSTPINWPEILTMIGAIMTYIIGKVVDYLKAQQQITAMNSFTSQLVQSQETHNLEMRAIAKGNINIPPSNTPAA